MPLPFGPFPTFPKTKGLQSGISLNDLVALISSSEINITATAGGGKANAFQLSSAVNKINVCATAGDSVLLPKAYAGLSIFIANIGAAAAQVFGQGSDTINAIATGIGVSQGNGTAALYVCTDVTAAGIGHWHRILTA